ncbi:MAG: peptidoglycan DD-metalloendopeptidase family protein [Bacteroidetes bacterium]|uniref:Peptidoglycan DD-metalloendopeptidase family protein n=1 Tax=Candidatus Cryptobacteroides merdavium TaxID=2840769 RepID=A0A9D9HD00_9BACT|nr:peptidoglycan DD-metalloendopeptidase family protein [Candidatus Cryptobacteroides merdavium]
MTMSFLRIFIAAIVLFFSMSWLDAQDTGAYKARVAALEKEMAIIDRQLSDNASKSRSLLSDLTLIRKRISNRKELINAADRQIRVYSDGIYSAQKQINRLEERIDTLSEHYGRLVRSAYKNRDAKIWYMYILASENLGQAFRRYGYFKNLSREINEQAVRIEEARAELEAEKERLQQLRKETEQVRGQRARELASLQADERRAENTVSTLKRDRRKYERQLAEKKKQVDALNREIKRLVAAAMKGSEDKSGDRPVDYKLASEFSKNRGKLPWPANGPVVDGFGQRYHPVFTKIKLPFNNGIDIALSPGTSVNAVFDGVVKQIVVMPGYNICILVQHGNYFSFYCKLQTAAVKAGDKVKTGQKMGTVDTINGETKLHFQIWQDQSPQDPELWLRKK